MQLPKEAVLLRIFVGEDDKANGQPLYEAIVMKARETGLAGATVLRGPMGYGRSSHLHTTKILRLSQDLPVVVEIVDQEDKLRQQLQATGVSVTRNGDSIILNMPGNITFATDSSNISADFYPVLDSVALVIKEYEKTYVDVVGHTDSTGAEAYNQQLSEARASSVARYLESQGVLPARVVSRGMGESQPIASNDTAQGRSLNRRVEIILTPVT